MEENHSGLLSKLSRRVALQSFGGATAEQASFVSPVVAICLRRERSKMKEHDRSIVCYLALESPAETPFDRPVGPFV